MNCIWGIYFEWKKSTGGGFSQADAEEERSNVFLQTLLPISEEAQARSLSRKVGGKKRRRKRG